MTDLLIAALEHITNGRTPIPLPPRSKKPTVRAWQKLRITAETAPNYFNGTPANVGILTGAASGGQVVVDADWPEAVAVAEVLLPSTTHRDGREERPPSHHWYTATGADLKTARLDSPIDKTRIVELLADGAQCLVWPSVHPSGARYRPLPGGAPPAVEYATLLGAVKRVAAAALLARHWPAAGGRHGFALALAGYLLNGGADAEHVAAIVGSAARAAGDEEAADRVRAVETTARRIEVGEPVHGGPTLAEYLDGRILDALAAWLFPAATNRRSPGPVAGRAPGNNHEGAGGDEGAHVPEAVAPRTLADVIATFRRWLYLPDPGLVHVVLATVAANYAAGDPLWLLIVGPSSSGKTEVLNAVLGLSDVHLAATMTEAALLSGTPKREAAKDAKGGLLRQIGDFGIIVAKDFTSVLSMNRDTRAALLAALREVFDGRWTRHIGTDGGRTLAWEGKVGLAAGCTGAWDSHHAVVSSMGERFVVYRPGEVDAHQQARKALALAGREAEMRRDLSAAVQGLFAGLDIPKDPPSISGVEIDRLIALGSLVAACRSAVERDGHSREIELVLDTEAPARLTQALRRLYGGLRTIGLPASEAWPLVIKTGLDSMPKTRRGVFQVLLGTADGYETAAVAAALGYPTATVRRALEDLAAHRVVERRGGGKGKADIWRLSDWALGEYEALGVPEMSGDGGGGTREQPPLYTPDTILTDFSGTPPGVAVDDEPERVCWRCKAGLDSSANETCAACDWLRCACGACAQACGLPDPEFSTEPAADGATSGAPPTPLAIFELAEVLGFPAREISRGVTVAAGAEAWATWAEHASAGALTTMRMLLAAEIERARA